MELESIERLIALYVMGIKKARAWLIASITSEIDYIPYSLNIYHRAYKVKTNIAQYLIMAR